MLKFRLFNIPIAVGTYFWIGSALLGGNVATGPNAVALLLVWIACVFVSIIVHELGHAFAARHFGLQPAVELQGLGGVTRMFGRPMTRAESFWTTLCGPAAGFGLYLAAFAADRWLRLSPGGDALYRTPTTLDLAAGSAMNFLLFINLWWTVFNLLPILPLDGGQMLRSLLGPGHLKITEAVGTTLAGTLATLAALRGNWYMAIFLGYLAFVNFQGNPRVLPGGTSR